MKPQTIVVGLLLLVAAVAAPAAAQDARKWSTPRTPWGEPDLQGTYSNRTITPFERPANVNGREFFTKEEVAGLESRGVIVVLEAEHLCMTMRGVRKAGARTITSAVRGQMHNAATRSEAMALINRHQG